ncbi:MAG: DNA-directed RNA polymerase subunit beta' [Acidobacteriota bacterium]
MFHDLDKGQLLKNFEAIRIGLASPEKIRSWSSGEVTKPETINYRTFKPERDGLFCARIFGPVTDWECLCGKYKRMKHRGVICDKCGVEVTLSKVRRERLGHIELATPCSHVWFFKGLPSRIGHLLDLTLRDLERILYFEAYVVVDPGDAPVKTNELLTEERYRALQAEHPGQFQAGMGAESIKELVRLVDVDSLSIELRFKMRNETSQLKRQKYAKRLKVVDAFRKSGNRAEWMILDVIPVIPPELRPLVPLDGGRFATSDLNDLYRRVINRNNRLKKLMELRAPEVIIRNEKRMLQEAVDALFDNGRRGRVLRGVKNRPLKSLSDTLKGKQGRFRQNLLGKRVDYSGRSVIVVGPELKLHQCGLPKIMALELFKPFIYNRLEKEGHATTIKGAKEMVENHEAIVWDILEDVIKQHPVLLNRAPTLHRLGIQAFHPVLIEGKAIKVHPLVCAAFNADFDGDQMAVHVPLSQEAQIEASVLMLASQNVLSPANGQPLAVPTQDIVLGCYYLTRAREDAKGKGHSFANIEEIYHALQAEQVELLTPIFLRYSGQLIDLTQQYDNQAVMHAEVQEIHSRLIETTVGRAIFNDHLPKEMPFVNGLLKKRGLQQLVNYCYLTVHSETTVQMLDELKSLGFLYATKAGFTISIDDLIIPDNKEELVEEARAGVIEVEQQYQDGAITNGERYNKVVAIWSDVTEKIADEMFDAMADHKGSSNELNSVFVMADSGARGSKQQIRQLAGMRGLMAKPSGEIIETPITANFREGLGVLQYFISTHGARKGLADTALKTADSGYLTRRLVDVAQDVIITKEDCETIDGVDVTALVEGGEIIEALRDRIVGRVALERVIDPFTGETLVEIGEEIDDDISAAIQAAGIEKVQIRSVLTCKTKRGLCQMCFGRNLATGEMVEMGEAVGVLAAQCIGEPGTQLTMRTFHIGGTASRIEEESTVESKNAGIVRFLNVQTITDQDGNLVVMNRTGSLLIQDDRGREKERYSVIYGAKLLVKEEQKIKPGQKLVEWDPYTFAILTELGGKVVFKDIVEGVTMKEELDEVTGLARRVIIDSPDEKRQPQILIKDTGGKLLKAYHIPSRAHLMIDPGDQLFPGGTLAKIPRETTKTKDITGGLPRVQELFEARKPKENAVITEIDGVVHYAGFSRNQRKIVVENEASDTKAEYLLPRGVHVNVQEGETVRAGEALMDGPRNPHDILLVLGEKELQRYLVNEIQEVYRLQGVNINDKHIEVIVRQMMRWIKVEEVGDTGFLLDEQVDKFRFQEENERVLAEKGKPASGRPLLLGITKASLSTDSFISAASFQETTRVLTEAAISGKIDYLLGLKENVIMGRLVPAGTGLEYYRNIEVESPFQDVAEEPLELDVAAQVEIPAILK